MVKTSRVWIAIGLALIMHTGIMPVAHAASKPLAHAAKQPPPVTDEYGLELAPQEKTKAQAYKALRHCMREAGILPKQRLSNAQVWKIRACADDITLLTGCAQHLGMLQDGEMAHEHATQLYGETTHEQIAALQECTYRLRLILSVGTTVR